MPNNREPMDDDELMSVIHNEQTVGYGYLSGDLSEERAKALDYYYGRPFGNEVPDRSQAMLLDVADTIEWIMPAVMKVFTAGDEIVAFVPVGAEDEEAAAQETAAINHIIMQQNNAFYMIYTWAKDGLLQKNGYVKVAWEENDVTDDEPYSGLTREELEMLKAQVATEGVAKIISERSNEDDLFDVTLRVKRKKQGMIRIMPVPPEEMLVSVTTDDLDIQKAQFVQHKSRHTLSEIRLMGYEIDDDISDTDDDSLFGSEWTARRQYGEQWTADSQSHASMRMVTLRESYIRVDYDGDGIAELRRVVHVHNTILDKTKGKRPANEVVTSVPFACWSPIPSPHEHIGRSYADLVMDLQYIKVTLLRQALDNMYMANNVRTAINQNTVNLDDLLITRPGGITRVNGQPGSEIMPLISPDLGSGPIQLIEYLDTVKENRTGITRYNQGLDANTLNRTATGINLITQAANQRIELIVRILAEIGMKSLFRLVHELMRKHSTMPLSMKLKGKYVSVDPRQWCTRTDLRISVGLGTGNKDQMLVHLSSIMAVQKEIIAGGGGGLVNAKNIYNTAKRMVENSGFKDADEFFTNPEEAEQMAQPEEAPAPDPIEMEKLRLDHEYKKASLDLEAQKAAAASEEKRAELELRSREVRIKEIEAQAPIDAAQSARIVEQSIMRIAQFTQAMQQTNEQLAAALVAPRVAVAVPEF